jgi:hypothetical protein
MDEGMNTTLRNLKKTEPVRLDVLEAFRATSGIELPSEYRNFLLFSNGAVGWVRNDSYLILWPLDKLLEYNEAYNVKEYAPSFLLFGSDGSGDAFAFDTSNAMRIVRVPFVGLDPKDAEGVAASFSEFLKSLEAGVVNE